MIRGLVLVVAWGLAGAWTLGARPAVAQQAEFPPDAPPTPGAAAEAAPAQPSAETACFPACRSGFTCHQGQCVSLCNPPCGAGERCLANGECELPASADAGAADEDIEDAEKPRDSGALNPVLRPAGSWVFAARAGLQVIGGGHLEGTCSATGQFMCGGTTKADFDERSYVKVGFDALIHAAPGLRLGLGYELLPYVAVKGESADDEETVHLGHEHGLGAIVEGMIPVSPGFALALRAQGGVRMLVVGGDLADRGERLLSNCYQEDAVRCEVDEGPMFGSGFGAMFGFVGGSRVRWRVDLAVDRTIMKMPSSSAQYDMETSVSGTSTLYATRSWVLGGFEL